MSNIPQPPAQSSQSHTHSLPEIRASLSSAIAHTLALVALVALLGAALVGLVWLWVILLRPFVGM